MSVEAISWAFRQAVTSSSAKFVLVAMANLANNEMECYPSTVYLCNVTGQDRKTVLKNIGILRENGYIVDTGRRIGRTKQIVVWRFQEFLSQDKKKESQKRNSSKNGTVPFFQVKSPNFPYKESQKRDTDTKGKLNINTITRNSEMQKIGVILKGVLPPQNLQPQNALRVVANENKEDE